jgi:hypothetical protein
MNLALSLAVVQNERMPHNRDLHLLARVDEEIGRLDVAVHDVAAVEVGEPGEDLAGKIRELRLAGDVGALQGPLVVDFAVV